MWEVLGSHLVERDSRPLAVLDLHGRILHANQSFRALLGRNLPQSLAASQWVHPDSMHKLQTALEKATGGSRALVTVVLPERYHHSDLVLDLERVGGSKQFVFAVVLEATAQKSAAPVSPVHGVTYEVTLGEATPRVIRGSQRLSSQEPCWQQMFGRATECPGCPVRRLDAHGAAVGVVPIAAPAFKVAIAFAERRTPRVVAVTTFELDEKLYRQVVSARIDNIAAACRLSGRERDLLPLLLEGRSLSEAAERTGITERTLRYHQQNLLRKVGVNSRQGLCRLVLCGSVPGAAQLGAVPDSQPAKSQSSCVPEGQAWSGRTRDRQ
jgi:DNA-binding CsgD family transcriptional regulator